MASLNGSVGPPPPISLRVALRIRPFQKHDHTPKAEVTVRTVSHDEVDFCEEDVNDDRAVEKQFRFDRVFGPGSTQESVFAECVGPLVDSLIDGVGGCIFAYGQTGSGKTFSMIGPDGGQDVSAHVGSEAGMLPMAAAEIFRRIARLENDAQAAAQSDTQVSAFEVRVVFLEIHESNVYDLLAPDNGGERRSLRIREDNDGQTYADGATAQKVSSVKQLLKEVVKGAKARTTAATNMNDTSSRSHALLTLTLEHRWVPAGATKEGGKTMFQRRVSRLTMADLAGSEHVERASEGRSNAKSTMSAGIHTNLGLHYLGRVMAARAAASDHVPYRDNPLTLLLKPSLDGNSLAWLLACVGPDRSNATQTLSTLKFARLCCTVALRPQRAMTTEVASTDPMDGDSHDPDPLLRRRALWIEAPGHGDVFARCAGDASKPLLLYVHGSGPQNSSAFWNEHVPMMLRASQGRFYIVAIDCPGYGRSPGDKQTIRSYPGPFLSAVVRALGRKSAAAIIGSSQGSAATLNAVLEWPTLSHAVALVHPVTHEPRKFAKCTTPTILMYDVDDPGHPVQVGRRLRSILHESRYFEFGSKDGEWDFAHLPTELLCLFRDKPLPKNCGLPKDKLPELTRIAGGLCAWIEGGEDGPVWGASSDGKLLEEQEEVEDGAAANGENDDVWSAVLDPSTNLIRYVHRGTGRSTSIRPPGATVLVGRLDGHGMSPPKRSSTRAVASGSKALVDGEEMCMQPADKQLFEQRREDLDSDDEAEMKEQENRDQAAQDEQEANQTHCDLCQKILIEPVRLAACRCALCACCVEETVKYTRHCPVCDTELRVKKGQTPDFDSAELARRTAERLVLLSGGAASTAVLPAAVAEEKEVEGGLGNFTTSFCMAEEKPNAEAKGEAKGVSVVSMERSAVYAQGARLMELRKERDAHARLVLEYGNTANPQGNRTLFSTSVAVKKVNGLENLKSDQIISRVEFNINPSYDRPTFVAREADTKGPKKGQYVYDYAMARTFPCVITVHFKDKVGLPPIELGWCVQDWNEDTDVGRQSKSEGKPFSEKRRIIIQLPTGGLQKRRSTKKLEYAADPPLDGWLRFNNEGQGRISYIGSLRPL